MSHRIWNSRTGSNERVVIAFGKPCCNQTVRILSRRSGEICCFNKLANAFLIVVVIGDLFTFFFLVCSFNGFWSRRLEATRESPWYIGGVDFPKIAAPQLAASFDSLHECSFEEGAKTVVSSSYKRHVSRAGRPAEEQCERFAKGVCDCSGCRDRNRRDFRVDKMNERSSEDLREEMRARASKHRDYYENLCGPSNTGPADSVHGAQMAQPAPNRRIHSEAEPIQHHEQLVRI